MITRKSSLVLSLVSVIPQHSRDCARVYAPRDIALARSLHDPIGIISKYITEDHDSQRQAYKIKNVLKQGTQERTNAEKMYIG
jgi:hypothetical protein